MHRCHSVDCVWFWLLSSICLLTGGCGGVQSALKPAGEGAREIAGLFWVMGIGAMVIWLVVVSLFVYAIHYCPLPHNDRRSRWTIIGGGVVVPTVVLTILLAYGLSLLPQLQKPAAADSVTIEVEGLQYWWRVRYLPRNQPPPLSLVRSDFTEPDDFVETANEIVLPVDQDVEFRLISEDVIHSFWIPSLGGKMDMMPGRINRLKLRPDRLGTYRGVCAEFCGESHAWMALDVRVVEPQAFEDWLDQQSSRHIPRDRAAEPQRIDSFMTAGCGSCHTVRGTEAKGRPGPDLTHFASRASIGAGRMPMNRQSLEQWLRSPDAYKPGINMPSFDHLSQQQLAAIVDYLLELR